MKATQYRHHVLFTLLALGVVILLSPLLITFDSVHYLIIRPSCLNCGNLTQFLQNQSLTAAMLSSLDVYKFFPKTN